jgi:hypothetical protein
MTYREQLERSKRRLIAKWRKGELTSDAVYEADGFHEYDVVRVHRGRVESDGGYAIPVSRAKLALPKILNCLVNRRMFFDYEVVGKDEIKLGKVAKDYSRNVDYIGPRNHNHAVDVPEGEWVVVSGCTVIPESEIFWLAKTLGVKRPRKTTKGK